MVETRMVKMAKIGLTWNGRIDGNGGNGDESNLGEGIIYNRLPVLQTSMFPAKT